LSAPLDEVAEKNPGRPAHPAGDPLGPLEQRLAEAKTGIAPLNNKLAIKDVLMDLKLLAVDCDRAKKMSASDRRWPRPKRREQNCLSSLSAWPDRRA
jgi:hypothetical protein